MSCHVEMMRKSSERRNSEMWLLGGAESAWLRLWAMVAALGSSANSTADVKPPLHRLPGVETRSRRVASIRVETSSNRSRFSVAANPANWLQAACHSSFTAGFLHLAFGYCWRASLFPSDSPVLSQSDLSGAPSRAWPCGLEAAADRCVPNLSIIIFGSYCGKSCGVFEAVRNQKLDKRTFLTLSPVWAETEKQSAGAEAVKKLIT